MDYEVSQRYGIFIGVGVVAAAAATVYFVSMGYSKYQQDLANQNQLEEVKGVPVSAIELPPPRNPETHPSAPEDLVLTPSLTVTTTPSLTVTTTLSILYTISPTDSTSPVSTSTIDIITPTNTPRATSTILPSSTPTPSQTPLINTPTPSQTQPSSTPTPIPPTSTKAGVPTIDPKLCKVEPDETRHPHYCTPTPGAGGS